MDLQVHIICPRCNQRKVLMIIGRWDIETVHHQCSGDLGEQYVDGRPLARGEFAVIFDPPRPVF